MSQLLVSMAVNKYRRNGSTDWRQRPECSHILSQLQTFMIKLNQTNLPSIVSYASKPNIWAPISDRL